MKGRTNRKSPSPSPSEPIFFGASGPTVSSANRTGKIYHFTYGPSFAVTALVGLEVWLVRGECGGVWRW